VSDPLRGLDERGLQARASLREATDARWVPAPPAARRPLSRTTRSTRWAVPALAAAAVVLVLIGVAWGGGHARRVVVTTGAVASVPAGQQPVAVATDGRTVWVADAGRGVVRAFDARTLRPTWTQPVGSRPVALAHAGDALWVVDAGSGRLLKLSATTGRVLETGRTSLDPVAVDVAFGSVWVLSRGNQTLDEYDVASVSQSASAILGAPGRAVTHSRDALWVSAPGGLLRITPAPGLPVTTVPLAGDPRQVAADGSQVVWIAQGDGTLLSLDAATGTPRGSSVALGAGLTSLTAVGTTGFAATDDGQVARFTRSGAAGQHVATTGTPVEALAARGRLLVGTAPSTAQLYATRVGR
jgi:outer membrane protein assembly factor BamB